ncbi:MAG: ABC transporter ATP-binding protein [Anaerolineales bacterium]|jgi:ABC-2 type transport system ATP-binding protein/lipopolysaccharide transport system ATP-binding protein|nr:ABC transporter ATP-binding protein [Anaerolineales bacterium]
MSDLTHPPREIIRLEKVSVKYRLPSERIGTFKEYIIRFIQRRIRFHSFWALHEVDLSVYPGEAFGIIGNNGAGKSTLLKVVSRVLRPTEGRVVVYGKIAPLLELGAGFHPELTGRENIFLNGALLGYSRAEMEACYQDILDFSELHEFIEAPIRTYSSGMYARLGFSVATAHQPDILIVDEILGVGDESFQQKCANRIAHFRENGTTILMVSHSMATIQRLCQRAAWIDHGRVMQMGEPAQVISAYRGN